MARTISKLSPRLKRRRLMKATRNIRGLDPAIAQRCKTRNEAKRALIAQAQADGWTGKRYRKAVRFTRKLDRQARARAAMRRGLR